MDMISTSRNKRVVPDIQKTYQIGAIALLFLFSVGAAAAHSGTCGITGTPNACLNESSKLSSAATPAASAPWESSNTAVATVDDTGLVQAKSAGSAFITFKASDGCTSTITFTVNALPSITGSSSVCSGSTITLTSSDIPAAANPWQSSKSGIANIKSTGQVTGLDTGRAVITYTNINGCKNTKELKVNGLPEIAASETVCINATKVLTSASTPATSNPWISSNSSIATVSSAGSLKGISAGTATVTFKDSNGCTSKAMSVTVYGLPSIDGTSTICAGASTELDGSGFGASTNPWTSSSTSVATVDNTGKVTAVAAGTTTITYTNDKNCSKTLDFTVVALPVPAFTTDATASTCTGNKIQFSPSFPNANNHTIQWEFGDGGTSSKFNPDYTYKAKGAGTTTYSVKITATDKTTKCKGNSTQSITLTEAPSIRLIDQAKGTVATSFKNCKNNISSVFTINLVDQTTGSSNLSINWGDGSPPEAQAFVNGAVLTHGYNAVGVFNVVYTASSGGCSTSQTIPVYNISNPAVGVGSPGSTTGLCAPDSLTFTILNFSNNDASTIYTITPAQNGPSFTFTHPPPATFTYKYTGTSCDVAGGLDPDSFFFRVRAENGCGFNSGTVSPITLSIPPKAKVTAPQYVCVDKPVLLDNQTESGSLNTGSGCDNLAQYNWDFGDNTYFPSQNGFTPFQGPLDQTKTYTAAGTYDVVLKAFNDCPSTTATTKIIVCGGPSVSSFNGTFNAITGNSTANQAAPGSLDVGSTCAPVTINLSNTTTNTCGTTYAWSVVSPASGYTFTGGNTTSTDENTAITITAGGTYLVRLTADNVCGSTTSFMNIVVPQPPTTTPAITAAAFYCSVDDITLTGSSSTGASSYLWTITGVPPTTDPNITVDRTSLSIGPFKVPAGNYRATLKAVNACGSIEGSVLFDVRPTPTPGIAIPLKQTLCQGENVTLSSTTSGGTFQWFIDGVSQSGATGSLLNVANAGVSNNTNLVFTLSQNINGCTATSAPQTITKRVKPSVTISTPVSQFCPGTPLKAPFTSTIAPAGGYDFTWFKDGAAIAGQTKDTVTAKTSGIYKLRADDGFCPVESTTTTIGVFAVPAVSVSASTNEICRFQNATLTAAGATSYSWSPATGLNVTNTASVTASPASNATYTVTATDGNGCKQDKTVSITVNARPTVTINPTKTEICLNGTDNSTLTAGGAVSYVWTPATGLSATNTAVVTAKPSATTTYSVIGTNAKGCQDTTTVEIKGRTAITASISSGQPKVFCDAGSISATLNADVSPSRTYNFQWKKGGTDVGTNSNSFSTTTTGSYTVVVSDTDGVCSITAAPWDITLFNPGSIVFTPAAPEVCKFQSVSISVSGADSFTWSPTSTLNASTGTTVSAKPLTNTTYSVEAKDANGCTQTASVTVKVLDRPTVTITPTKSIICLDGSDNTALTAGGALTYAWQAATGLAASTSTTVTAKPTAASTIYKVIGTDAKGCQDTTEVTIAGREKITATADTSDPKNYCPGDAVNATLNAAVSPARDYAFSWSKDGTPVTGTTAALSINSTGSYAVTVKDTDNVCSTTSATVAIGRFTLPAITFSPANPAICKFQSTSITVSGASSYSWSPSTKLDATNTATVTASPLSTTTYTVTATDANACKQDKTITVQVNERPIVSVTNSKPTICLDGTDGTTLGASGAVTYAWSPSTGLSATDVATVTAKPSAASTVYSVIGTDAIGCQDTTTVTVSGREKITVDLSTSDPKRYCPDASVNTTLNANTTPARTYDFTWTKDGAATAGSTSSLVASATGSYIVTVKDTDNVCTIASSAVVIDRFTLPDITFSPANPGICKFGSVSVTVSGASSYSWSPGTGLSGTSTATVTASPLSTSTYTVTATDANSCKQDKTVTVQVNERPIVSVTNSKPTICLDGTDVTTLGASGAVTYVWSPSTGLSATDAATVTAKPGTASTIYSVIGTDAIGCQDTTSVTVSGREKITVDLTTSDPKRYCPDAAVNTTLNANTTPARTYDFTWTKDGAATAGTGSSLVATATGSYIVTVKDTDNVCTIASSAVVVDRFTLPAITFSPSAPEICKYQSVDISVSGANAYVWAPNDRLSSTSGVTVTASPLATRTYTVTATDNNNCNQDKTIQVKVNPLPVVDLTATKTGICQGQSTALTATGAVSYAWSPATGLSALTGSAVTAAPTATITYQVIGTDAKTCQDTTTLKINVSDAINVTIATTDPLQFCTDPQINTLFKATATPRRPYSFVWLKDNTPITGATDTAFTAKATGSYKIRVSDSVCETESAATGISLFPRPSIVFTPTSPQAICRYDSISIGMSGAVTYSWSPALGLDRTSGAQVKASPPATQTYTVSTVDSNLCTKDLTFTLNVNQLPTVVPASAENSLCYGTSTLLSATGAQSYAWSPAEGLSATTGNQVTANPLRPVRYSIVGTDAKGCKDTADFNLVVRPEIPAAITTSDNLVFCTPAEIKANLSTPPVAGFTYEWFLNNSSVPASNNPSFLATLAGRYTVKVSDADLKCNRTSAGIDIGVFAREPLAISPAQPGICRGDFVTISASGGVSYTWKNVLDPDRTGTSISVSPADNLEFFLKSVDRFNCPDSLKFTVEVNDVPVVKIDAPDTELCIGESTDIKSSGADLYTWSPALGLSSTTDSLIRADPRASTTYQVIGRSFYGCSDTTTVRITVYELPTLSAGNDVTYCDNFGTVALDNNTGLTPPGGEWSGTAVLAGNIFDPSAAVIGANTLTYTVTDPATGCKNRDNAILTVRKPPAVNFTMPDRICINVPLDLPNTTPAFPGNTLTYRWDYGNGGNATSNDGSTVFTTAGTYSVNLRTESTPDRCFNEVTKSILAVDPPQAAFSRSGAENPICGPSKILFTNNSTGTELIYNWDFGNGVTSNAAAPDSILFEPNPYVDTTYQIVLRLVSGEPTCPAVQRADSVVMRPNPTAEFIFTSNPICADFPLDINNFSYGKGTQFIWDFGDGSTRTDLFTGTIQHIFRNNTRKDTVYQVTLSVTNECKTSVLQRDITVTPNKVVAFYEATTIQGCEPLKVDVKSNQIAASKNELIWDWGDGTFTNGGLTTSHTYDKPGEYLPKLTVRNGCNVDTCRFDAIPSCGVKVQVLRSPRPVFEVNNPICLGDRALVVNQTLDQISSRWDFGDGSASVDDFGSPSHLYGDVGNYTISHEVSYSNGCRASFSRPIEVVPLPRVDFRAPPVICADQPFTVRNLSSNAESFIWKLVPDDPKLVALEKDLDATIPSTGVYPLRLIAFTQAGQRGCTDSLTRLVSVGRVPKPEFLFTQKQQCDSLLIDVDNITSYPDPEDGKFTWSIGPFVLSEVADPGTLTYIYSKSDAEEAELKLSIRSINGCIDSVKQTIQVPAFDERVRVPDKMLAFVPGDPVNGYFRLDTDNASGVEFSFSVYSQWGNQLYSTTKREGVWDGYYGGAVAPAGSYVARVDYRGCRTGDRYSVKVPFVLLRRAN